MHLTDFTPAELRALIALLRQVMVADGHISDAEADTLESFALELGRDAWTAAVTAAEAEADSRDHALGLARAVERDTVQDDILARLCRMSGLDGAQTEELDVVADLIALWQRGA